MESFLYLRMLWEIKMAKRRRMKMWRRLVDIQKNYDPRETVASATMDWCSHAPYDADAGSGEHICRRCGILTSLNNRPTRVATLVHCPPARYSDPPNGG